MSTLAKCFLLVIVSLAGLNIQKCLFGSVTAYILDLLTAVSYEWLSLRCFEFEAGLSYGSPVCLAVTLTWFVISVECTSAEWKAQAFAFCCGGLAHFLRLMLCGSRISSGLYMSRMYTLEHKAQTV